MREANQRLIRRVIDEIWTAGNVDLVDELFAPDFECHLEPAGSWSGREGVKQWLEHVHRMLGSHDEQIDAMISDGDRVVVRTTITGVITDTETGAEKPISTMSLVMYRISNGLVAEQWEVANISGILAQLGSDVVDINPPPEPPSLAGPHA